MEIFCWVGSRIDQNVKNLSDINLLPYLLSNTLRLGTQSADINSLLGQYGGSLLKFSLRKVHENHMSVHVEGVPDEQLYSLSKVEFNGFEVFGQSNRGIYENGRDTMTASTLANEVVARGADNDIKKQFILIIDGKGAYVRTSMRPDSKTTELCELLTDSLGNY